MKCLACKSEIEVLSAQLRSADEARGFIHTCPKCPLQLSKFADVKKVPHSYMPRIETSKVVIPEIKRARYSNIYVVSVHTKAPDNLSEFKKAMCYNIKGQNNDMFKCYISGPFKGLAVREVARTKVGPYSYVISYRAAKYDYPNKDMYTSIQYLENGKYTHIFDGKDHQVIAHIKNKSIESICDALEEIYIYGYAPTTLKNVISPALLGSLSNLTARAYDQSEIDTNEYETSTKPDGDRIWLMRIGLVWISSKRLIGHQVVFWNVDRSIVYENISTVGPCIDLELMHSGLSSNIFHRRKYGSPILIDVLMNESEKVSSQQRHRKWIYSEFERLRSIFPYLQSVYMRPFRTTVEEALEDCKTCGYPTDGAVAIHNKGTDMLKIKSIKSVELRANDQGVLCTEDGAQLFAISPLSVYPPGSIVEIKFSVLDKKMVVDSHFLRTDKTTANTSNVVRSIVISTTPKSSRNILRSEMWRWSNMVRTYLYTRASRLSQNKQIMIDVGTGDGQSVESFIDNKSYIIIEKDIQSCQSLARRLRMRQDQIYTKPRSIIPHIARMKRGIVKYHIINTSLQEFLEDETIRDNIKGLVGCCVSSFSAQYIIECIPKLYSLEIPFIGTCYMYEGIDIGESIIDSGGLSMKRISKDSASVRWGDDTVYIEPALDYIDLPPGISAVSLLNDVPYPSTDTKDPGYIASRHVKILIYT